MPRSALASPYAAAMRSFGPPPSADEIEAIARGALNALPEPFVESLGDVVLLVEEFADEGRSQALGIEDPFELSGVYEGIPLTERSVEQSGHVAGARSAVPAADPRRMGRRRATRSSISSRHVLIHEIGHHFGFSDDDMHALEDSVA